MWCWTDAITTTKPACKPLYARFLFIFFVLQILCKLHAVAIMLLL